MLCWEYFDRNAKQKYCLVARVLRWLILVSVRFTLFMVLQKFPFIYFGMEGVLYRYIERRVQIC